MKLFARISASRRRRGLLGTLALVPQKAREQLSRSADRLYDLHHRTDTRQIVELEALTIGSPNRHLGIRYEPTRARPFRKLLQDLKLPRDGAFVDFGCGKGRVLLMALGYGFPRVVGVDFSPELCDMARRNLERACENSDSARVVFGEATDLAIEPDHTIFYFFNPFAASVMRDTLANIAHSLKTHPRQIWIIYHNPVWREVIDAHTAFRLHGEFDFSGACFVVYEST